MGFFYYLGILLWIWLIVGFIVSLKMLFIDGGYKNYQNAIDRYLAKKEKENNETGVIIGNMFKKSKLVFVVSFTLLGFISLYWEFEK